MNVGLPVPSGFSGAPAPQPGQPLLSVGYMQGGLVESPSLGIGSGKPTPALLERRINAALRDPNTRESLMARPRALLAAGELDMQEVQMIARVAEAALYNPDLYPQLRQFIAEQGMTPLPAAYDQLVVLRIVAIARALQEETPQGQIPSMDQAAMFTPTPNMRGGGYIVGPGNGQSDSIGTINATTGQPVRVSNNEYVIPEPVLKAKGREFFDNLLRRYGNAPEGEA